MFLFLVLLLIVVPIVEIAVLIQVGQLIGILPTIALLLLVSMTGAWLVKREGLSVVRRATERAQSGQAPGKELVDGMLIFLAGALLLIPGFVTDALGILLLLPPVRAVVRASAWAYFSRRAGNPRVLRQ